MTVPLIAFLNFKSVLNVIRDTHDTRSDHNNSLATHTDWVNHFLRILGDDTQYNENRSLVAHGADNNDNNSLATHTDWVRIMVDDTQYNETRSLVTSIDVNDGTEDNDNNSLVVRIDVIEDTQDTSHTPYEIVAHKDWVQNVSLCTELPYSYTCANDKVHIWGDLPFALMRRPACSILEQRKIRTITFCGDSYIRHAYQALLLILTGDYETGSMRDDFKAECSGDAQFEESKCRHGLPHAISGLCSGAVTLKLVWDSWPVPSLADLEASDLFVWGGGEHPVNGDYQSHYGVNDADVVSQTVLEPHCTADLQAHADKIVFMLPHYRTRPTNEHESAEMIRQYVQRMPSFLQDKCKISRILDTHTFTEKLASTVPADVVQSMTWDGAHWSRAVNIVKAWLLLHELSVVK